MFKPCNPKDENHSLEDLLNDAHTKLKKFHNLYKLNSFPEIPLWIFTVKVKTRDKFW
jgi:hypothetical protein